MVWVLVLVVLAVVARIYCRTTTVAVSKDRASISSANEFGDISVPCFYTYACRECRQEMLPVTDLFMRLHWTQIVDAAIQWERDPSCRICDGTGTTMSWFVALESGGDQWSSVSPIGADVVYITPLTTLVSTRYSRTRICDDETLNDTIDQLARFTHTDAAVVRTWWHHTEAVAEMDSTTGGHVGAAIAGLLVRHSGPTTFYLDTDVYSVAPDWPGLDDLSPRRWSLCLSTLVEIVLSGLYTPEASARLARELIENRPFTFPDQVVPHPRDPLAGTATSGGYLAPSARDGTRDLYLWHKACVCQICTPGEPGATRRSIQCKCHPPTHIQTAEQCDTHAQATDHQ